MFLNISLHPYILTLTWGALQYVMDFGFVYLALKFLPMEKLPFFTNDFGNFLYTIALTYVVIYSKAYVIDVMANQIWAKHLGVTTHIHDSNPLRLVQLRVKREIHIIYEDIIDPNTNNNMKRVATLANLEIIDIEKGGTFYRKKVVLKKW